MKKISTIIILSWGLALNSHATSIAIISDKNQINVGDSVEMQVRINGLNDLTGPSVGDYDVNFNYNANIFRVSSITWGDMALGNQLDLSDFGSLQGHSNTASGILNLFELSFDNPWDLNSLQAGSFNLFSVFLSATAQGTGIFSININAIGDAFGNSIDVDTINSTQVKVNRTQLPEPSPLLLLLGGLMINLLRARKL